MSIINQQDIDNTDIDSTEDRGSSKIKQERQLGIRGSRLNCDELVDNNCLDNSLSEYQIKANDKSLKKSNLSPKMTSKRSNKQSLKSKVDSSIEESMISSIDGAKQE